MNGSSERIFSVFIAEDEVPARELLVDYLVTRPELQLAGIARNGEEALVKLSGQDYDLVFMDINLPRMSGIDVLERLKSVPYVIFTTAYDTYAIRAFDVGAVDFLLKPFDMKRFNRSVEKFLSLQDASAGRNRAERHAPGIGLAYRDGGRHRIVPYGEIVYACSRGKNSVLHTVSGALEVPLMLKDLEIKIPAELFVRIHKQHIVNIQFITEMEYYIGGQYIAHLKDDDESVLPVGRKYAAYLKSRLNIE
ncbi:MAG TPA: LytTR family DNA-binding domain-containing protein [Spirochaetota bacterium]|nr:LytTR family DNA-binding domain-containing protein [Spirochaetota bacterium]HPC40074.1 LytTR family DNA-binding domain-containing protein [Spirochaetota bacterium]HPL16862.1 LytTR family DNA-binding domain-containing protein [Spirochaetota bacterium]HQF08478.1 LytTR family DNA-binding domain-containing protein [Spirochaetota bacterium]HQH97285.1 LytTR family DNA-binding domain-containing protein [Spirochaetota bacterium]